MSYKKIFIMSWIMSTFIVIIYCIVVKNSIVNTEEFFNNEDVINDFYISQCSFNSIPEILKHYESIFDYINKESSNIFIVKHNKRVLFTKKNVVSEVKVIDVIKGDKNLKNKCIYIYESGYFYYFKNGIGRYDAGENYNLMNSSETYILFLNKRNYPEKYNRKKYDINSFELSDVTFGKFSTRDCKNTILTAEIDTYKKVKKLDILTDDKEILQHYLKCKNRVLIEYKEKLIKKSI